MRDSVYLEKGRGRSGHRKVEDLGKLRLGSGVGGNSFLPRQCGKPLLEPPGQSFNPGLQTPDEWGTRDGRQGAETSGFFSSLGQKGER